jgi:hypothetical protein
MDSVTPDELERVVDAATAILDQTVERDWSRLAGSLEWTCWATIDHTIDCLFSYAMQVAARAESGFLPFNELHAQPHASPQDLVTGVGAVGRLFLGVARSAPADAQASDGVVCMPVPDWCARAAYEVALHVHDVVSGLGLEWQLTADLAESITASRFLWMFDRPPVDDSRDPWTELLVGSGRTATG